MFVKQTGATAGLDSDSDCRSEEAKTSCPERRGASVAFPPAEVSFSGENKRWLSKRPQVRRLVDSGEYDRPIVGTFSQRLAQKKHLNFGKIRPALHPA
jgi:hypothetical protein